jgi:hypothetical protein
MSTQLRNVTSHMAQTRFWGGENRGVCVQVSQKNFEGGHQFLQLTKEDAALLAAELTLFVLGHEVVDMEAEI